MSKWCLFILPKTKPSPSSSSSSSRGHQRNRERSPPGTLLLQTTYRRWRRWRRPHAHQRSHLDHPVLDRLVDDRRRRLTVVIFITIACSSKGIKFQVYLLFFHRVPPPTTGLYGASQTKQLFEESPPNGPEMVVGCSCAQTKSGGIWSSWAGWSRH